MLYLSALEGTSFDPPPISKENHVEPPATSWIMKTPSQVAPDAKDGNEGSERNPGDVGNGDLLKAQVGALGDGPTADGPNISKFCCEQTSVP